MFNKTLPSFNLLRINNEEVVSVLEKAKRPSRKRKYYSREEEEFEIEESDENIERERNK